MKANRDLPLWKVVIVPVMLGDIMQSIGHRWKKDCYKFYLQFILLSHLCTASKIFQINDELSNASVHMKNLLLHYLNRYLGLRISHIYITIVIFFQISWLKILIRVPSSKDS